MSTKKIAIIGAGFSGLATAWHLYRADSSEIQHNVTLFDPGEIGNNASGISAGLLHTYVGAHAKLVKNGRESKEETLTLIDAASKALGKPVAICNGQLRIAASDIQKIDFQKAAELHDDIEWWDAEVCQIKFPGLTSNPGIWIKSSHTVNTELYLTGLLEACTNKGLIWEKKKIDSLAELDSFDTIIVAGGSEVTTFPELAHLKIKPIKGQILEIEWPQELEPLKYPINSRAYIVPTENPRRCIVGATFERDFTTFEPDEKSAIEYLKPRMTELFPSLDKAKIISCKAAFRASTPSRLPIIEQVSSKVWVISGMRSKGLLFHAIYAKELVQKICNPDIGTLTTRN